MTDADAAESPVGPQNYRASPWFFLCGPLAANVFALGLAANLLVFQRHELALHRVLDMRRDEVPTARGVALFALALGAIQLAVLALERWRRGGDLHANERGNELLLLLYAATGALLLLCPFDVCHRRFRQFLVKRLGNCLWPFQRVGSFQLPAHPTPFVEVFIADGLTSLSKFIQDAAVALLLFSLSLSAYAQDEDRVREAYVSKMKASPLPYLAASLPYIIRATQCIISFQRTTSVSHRSMHLLNTLKYCSSLLVIFVGAYPQVMGHAKPEKNSFFLLCAVFNSLYSFVWDVVMDWGLGQPKLPRRRAFLRHQLLYRPRNIYYLVIAVDFALRILWVTKWWDWLHDGVEFKLVSQVAEAARRIIWNFLRVEWQCLKLEALGPTKKLSGDEAALESSLASMETVPVTTEDEEDEFGADVDPDGWRHSLIAEMAGDSGSESDSDDDDGGSDSEKQGLVRKSARSASRQPYRRVTRGNSFSADDDGSLESGDGGGSISSATTTVTVSASDVKHHFVSSRPGAVPTSASSSRQGNRQAAGGGETATADE